MSRKGQGQCTPRWPHLAFSSFAHSPLRTGSQFPGVCIEEGEWEEQRQVYLVSQGLCHPFLFLFSFLVPPRPAAEPQIAPSPFFPPTIRATPLTLFSFPNPPFFLSTIRLGMWRGPFFISRLETKTLPATMVDTGVLRVTWCWKEKPGWRDPRLLTLSTAECKGWCLQAGPETGTDTWGREECLCFNRKISTCPHRPYLRVSSLRITAALPLLLPWSSLPRTCPVPHNLTRREGVNSHPTGYTGAPSSIPGAFT